MKYKIKLVCIFMMLMICSVFVNANVLNKQLTDKINEENLVTAESSNLEFETTDDIVLSSQSECVVIFTDPKIGYIYFQAGENIKPTQGDQQWPGLVDLNLALYICLGCQMYVEAALDDCPDATKAVFSMKTLLTGYEYTCTDDDLTDGVSCFFNLPCLSRIYTELRVLIYDNNDNLLASDDLPNNVVLITIAPPS